MVMAVAVIMSMVVAVAFRRRLGGRVAMLVIMVVVAMAVMVVVLAHASFPLAGSAICSSISPRTPLMWASAAV